MASKIPELETPRLRLRAWGPEDLPRFAEVNADPRVTEYLLGPITRPQSDALVDRFVMHFEREGFGWWAVEAHGVSSFIGAVGISVPAYTAPFTPCVEIGWRLAKCEMTRSAGSRFL